jgi:licheninase
MLSSLLALAAASLAPTPYSVSAPMHAPAGAPSWSDEFNGTALDRSKWSFDTSRNKIGWYNDEKEYYSGNRAANLRLENGQLIIEARHDPQEIRKFKDWGGQQYSSAKITTQGKFAFRYGFAEIRAKLPCARGTWPAIWMMPDYSIAWPKGGEIDIMEQVGWDPGVVHGTLHTVLFNDNNNGRGAPYSVPTSCSDFHRYQMSWTPQAITIGVDDHAYMQVKNDQPGGRNAWPFDKPFYFILNDAIGGGWGGVKGIDDAAFPQDFDVDYVRVWKQAS